MIQASSQPERYRTAFTNGGQTALADTTADKGGGGAGFRPHELLEAALASCPVRKTLAQPLRFAPMQP